MSTLKQNNFTFQIDDQSIGQRLDKFLADNSSLKSFIPTRSFAQNMIDKGFITVNQKAVKTSYTLKLNDVVEIHLPEKSPTTLIPYDFPLDIVHEDDDLIVVNKPAGLVVHPAAGHEKDTLVNALVHHTRNLSMKNEERPGIVHRIDKETSGLLVIAKNDEAHEHLSQQFKDKTTHRIYYAVLNGTPLRSSGTIKSYLARHPTDRKKYCSIRSHNRIITEPTPDFEKGKWAVTHYQILELSQKMSLAQIKLETGRTHQIRVHMSELNHPLIGDITYGFSVKLNKELKIHRFYLHAAELGFFHPKTLEPMLFKINWPEADLNQIRSWGFKYYDK
ncbi:MAG: RluA family pseudouridine synthase [Pseudobdellovibrio sp.]